MCSLLRISTPSLVFTLPELGKPDPKLPRPMQGPDNRPRIIQLGSKDNNCTDSVFNMLRNRIKAPNTQELKERKFEELSSKRRKAVTKHNGSLPDLVDQLNSDIIRSQFILLKKEDIQKPGAKIVFDILDSTSKVKLSSVFGAFLSQNKYDNLYDFLCNLKLDKYLEINETFLLEAGVDLQMLYDTLRSLDPIFFNSFFPEKKYENLPKDKKLELSNYFVRDICTKNYGLKKSTWHPKDSFESFQEELRQHRFLALAGRFGRAFYQVSATKSDKVFFNREVYFWKKNDPKNSTLFNAHMILVIGAEKTNSQNLVYYIDPIDDSDPNHPEKQHIYTMSYERLTSNNHICDYLGCLRNDAPISLGYALYRDWE